MKQTCKIWKAVEVNVVSESPTIELEVRITQQKIEGTEKFREVIHEGEYTKLNNLTSIKEKLESSNNWELHPDIIIYPGINSKLPRFKLEMFYKKYKLYKTKSVSLAQLVILDRKETEEILFEFSKKRRQFLMIPVDGIGGARDLEIRVHNLTKAGVNFEAFAIRTSKPEQLAQRLGLEEGEYFFGEYIKISRYRNQKYINSFKNLYEVATNKFSRIMYDDEIIEELNEKGHKVDDEVYNTINGLLSSPDKENIQLGLEILANCRFDESLVRMNILLYKNWGSVVSWNTHWNTNVASMIRYVDEKGAPWRLEDWNIFASGLYEKFTDPEDKKEVEKFVLSELKGILKDKIENIEFK